MTYMHHEDLTVRVANALNTTAVRSVITLGRSLEQSVVVPPAYGIVVSWAPHERLLPAAAAIVTHAGLGTILAALSAGAPDRLPAARARPA